MKKFSSAITAFLLFVSLALHAQNGQLTNLPALYITTDEGLPVDSKSTWRTGHLTISAPFGTEGAYDGAVEIRGRGNSTWEMDKKPYRIRLASKYQLLGMPAKERNWVLLANYADKTLFRNALAFEISKFLGLPYSCPYRFVDVFLNNTYIGNYTLTDQIERADKRVEIDKQEITDTGEPAISGGYLLEADGFADQEVSKFYTSRGMKFTIKYPDDKDINPEQLQYISNYFQQIENRLFSADFQDAEQGYMRFMDKKSLVNWYIACEITGNPDSFWSTYMFKKKNDEKIYFGPLWDYDIAFNNDDRLGDATFKRMSANGHFDANRIWIERMLEDADFRSAVAQRWKELKTAGLNNYLNTLISNFEHMLSQSQAKNFEVWPVLDQKVYHEYQVGGSYADQVGFLRNSLSRRIAWLEMQLTGELGRETYYKIVNKYTGKVLASGPDGASVVQKNYVASDHAHHWLLSNTEMNGTRFYTITNRGNGKRILSSGNESLAQLRLSANVPDAAQQWNLIPLSDNIHFGIVNRANGFAIDNLNQSADENNMIIQYHNDIFNNVNQQWEFVQTYNAASALPIYTSGFSGKIINTKAVLSWKVYESRGGSYFEITRFKNPADPARENIGTVPLTDSGIGDYHFTDENPLPGTAYYQLKQVDLDGSITYSRIISVKNTVVFGLSVWPMPATSEATIAFSSPVPGNGHIEIYNITGVKIAATPVTVRQGPNTFPIDLKNLTQGLYLIKIVHGDETATLKLVRTND